MVKFCGAKYYEHLKKISTCVSIVVGVLRPFAFMECYIYSTFRKLHKLLCLRLITKY